MFPSALFPVPMLPSPHRLNVPRYSVCVWQPDTPIEGQRHRDGETHTWQTEIEIHRQIHRTWRGYGKWSTLWRTPLMTDIPKPIVFISGRHRKNVFGNQYCDCPTRLGETCYCDDINRDSWQAVRVPQQDPAQVPYLWYKSFLLRMRK